MLRTLIVEDNAIFRQALKEMLTARFPSMTIQEAVDGKQAMEKMATFYPNVVFMDIRLPGENGLEVTRRIRGKQWPAIIIVLTNNELPEYKNAAYSSGANYFLTKGNATRDEITSLIEAITHQIRGEEWEQRRAFTYPAWT